MATKSENADIAVLQSQMIEVKSSILDLKKDQHEGFEKLYGKLEEQSKVFATKDEVEDLRKHMSKNKTLERLLLVVASVIITFLLTFFLNNITKSQTPIQSTNQSQVNK